MKHLLQIHHLQASIEDKPILHDISLTVRSGETHAIMGPNGGGKSTLSYVLMGHPSYQIQPAEIRNQQSSQIVLDGKDLSRFSTEDRAKAGLFLAMQSPVAIPGVNVLNLLRTAYEEIYGSSAKKTKASHNPALSRQWKVTGITFPEFIAQVKRYAAKLHIDDSFLSRGIHDGFSGGEKKKIEMLETLVLQPKFAIFDEIDTGLDVDALKIVASGIKILTNAGTGVIVITHYQRILKYIHPQKVHILVAGKIVESGSDALAGVIEKQGYAKYIIQ